MGYAHSVAIFVLFSILIGAPVQSSTVPVSSAVTENYPNITVVIGDKGSGKSTFIKFIAGDPAQLYSKPIKNNNGETVGFTFVDIDQKNGGKAPQSSLEVPQCTLESQTNSPICEFSGFEDNSRSQFMKKAKAIKFVFVVKYNSMLPGGDNKDFIKLAKSVTDMIKSIDKFTHGIFLVATRVDAEKADNDVVDNVVKYLENVRNEYSGSTQQNEKGLQQRKNIVKFVEALLETNAAGHRKIDFIRQPKQEGLISNIPSMQERKQSLLKLLQETKFVQYSSDDFN